MESQTLGGVGVNYKGIIREERKIKSGNNTENGIKNKHMNISGIIMKKKHGHAGRSGG
jgi:hypothetical protein